MESGLEFSALAIILLTIEINALAKHIIVLSATPVLSHVNLIVEVRIMDRELLGIDPDDWA